MAIKSKEMREPWEEQYLAFSERCESFCESSDKVRNDQQVTVDYRVYEFGVAFLSRLSTFLKIVSIAAFVLIIVVKQNPGIAPTYTKDYHGNFEAIVPDLIR